MIKITKNIKELEEYLHRQKWLGINEHITAVEVPGEGNMNFTLRVRTDQGSFILKQSRDYVEKYPQVSAPVDRAMRESEFYNLVADHNLLKRQMPALLGVDVNNYVLKLQDLGEGVDYSFLYEEAGSLDEVELQEIIGFVAELHTSVHLGKTGRLLPNRKMRKLNHEHIFIYPFHKNNGLNLDDILPGLNEIGNSFKEDVPLLKKVEQLGERYLKDGSVLLHGDYFPGSWLKTSAGVRIIDPEFCFFGEPEFEIGVTLAHLKLAAQPQIIFNKALESYMDRAPLQKELCFQFMATEILRRILGLAQLPLSIGLTERIELLQEAKDLLV